MIVAQDVCLFLARGLCCILLLLLNFLLLNDLNLHGRMVQARKNTSKQNKKTHHNLQVQSPCDQLVRPRVPILHGTFTCEYHDKSVQVWFVWKVDQLGYLPSSVSG